MAKVILIAGIQSLHGRLGGVYYRTLKNGQVVMCRMPKKNQNKVISNAQQAQRERFGKIVKKVNEIIRDEKQRKMMEDLYHRYGKKKETFRTFLYHHVNSLYPK